VVLGRYQGIERLQDLSTMGNETVVEIYEANKLTQLSCGGGLVKMPNDIDLAVKWTNALAADVVA
jgi:hypothetical protein